MIRSDTGRVIVDMADGKINAEHLKERLRQMILSEQRLVKVSKMSGGNSEFRRGAAASLETLYEELYPEPIKEKPVNPYEGLTYMGD